MAKKKFIQKAIQHPGAFTRKAKAHGESVGEFIQDVKAHPEKYSARTKRQANLAKTLRSMHHKKKNR